jgi:hypothetical protein
LTTVSTVLIGDNRGLDDPEECVLSWRLTPGSLDSYPGGIIRDAPGP